MGRPSHPSECYHMQWNPWRPDDLGPAWGDVFEQKGGVIELYPFIEGSNNLKMYGKILGLGFLVKILSKPRDKTGRGYKFMASCMICTVMENMAKTTLPSRERSHIPDPIAGTFELMIFRTSRERWDMLVPWRVVWDILCCGSFV